MRSRRSSRATERPRRHARDPGGTATRKSRHPRPGGRRNQFGCYRTREWPQLSRSSARSSSASAPAAGCWRTSRSSSGSSSAPASGCCRCSPAGASTSASATSAAMAVLLAAQLTSFAVATRLFRRRTDGPLLAFWTVGNPTFWTAPVATATLGAEAAVFIIAYDMLTQARIALMVRFLRAGAPKEQSARTAIADYAPTIGALTGLAIGFVLPAPDVVDHLVAGLGHRDGLHRLPAAGRLLAEALDRQAAGGDDRPRARGAPDDRPALLGLGDAGRRRPPARGVAAGVRPDPDLGGVLRAGLRLFAARRRPPAWRSASASAIALLPLALALAG